MNLRVLVVESDPEEMLFLQDALTELDGSSAWSQWTKLEVEYCSTWEEAARALATSRADVMLLDLEQEDSQGKATFQRYQAGAASVPAVLLVRGEEDVALAETLLREGAQDFLVRGQVDCAPLARAMRNAVERHRLLASTRATSMIDTLTGLLSRDAFLLLAERDRCLAGRLGRRQLVILAEPKASGEGDAASMEQQHDLALVEAADYLRNLAGATDLVARVGPAYLAISILDSEQEDAEAIWVRLHNCGESGRIQLGAAVFDPERPVGLEQLLDQASRDMRPIAATAPM